MKTPYKEHYPSSKQWEQLISSGISQYKIADQLGIGQQTVGKWIRYGLPSDRGATRGRRHSYFKLSSEEFQIILGSVLGDGNLYRRGRSLVRNVKLQEVHSESQKPYLEWKAERLQRLGAKIRSFRGSGFGKIWPKVKLDTKTLPNLVPLWEAFYPIDKKIVPSILWSLEPLGLAVWWMDDGNYTSGRLSTQSFTEADNIWLAEEFSPRKFGLSPVVKRIDPRTSKNRVNFVLKFHRGYQRRLLELVQPYIHPSMRYKIGL